MLFGLPSQKKDTAIVAGLLGLNVLVRALVALRPLEYLDGLTIPDDAYLSLTLARNIARGLGPLYGFEHTNGFQPLYVFLMVPVFWLFPNDNFAPLRASFFLLIVFDTLTLYVLYRFTKKISASAFPPLIVAVAWMFSPYIIGTTLNGLETTVAVFFMVASVYFFYLITEGSAGLPTRKQQLSLGMLLGCAILARIDNGFLALSIAAVFLWRYRRENASALLRSLLLTAFGAGVVVAPWFLYSYAYTGLLYPVSGKAVRFNSLSDVQHQPTFFNLYLPMMRRAAGVLVRKNWVQILLLAVTTFLVLKKEGVERFVARLRPVVPALLFALLLIAAYTCYIFTSWFFDRYLYPAGVVLLLTLGVALDRFFALYATTRRAALTSACATLLVLLTLNLLQPAFRDLFTSTDTQSRGYMNLGLWARRAFNDGTRVGLQQSGAVGYFADNLRVINLDGVVNEACYRSLVERRNMEYIKSCGIEYVVCWPVDKAYIINHSTAFQPGDLTLVKVIEEFRSWHERWYVWRVAPLKSSAASP